MSELEAPHAHGKESFEYAYQVLQWCKEIGVYAWVEMFSDGSGRLAVKIPITKTQSKRIEEMLHSVRWHREGETAYLTSCCGWKP